MRIVILKKRPRMVMSARSNDVELLGRAEHHDFHTARLDAPSR
jgi:hypothetical protein